MSRKLAKTTVEIERLIFDWTDALVFPTKWKTNSDEWILKYVNDNNIDIVQWRFRQKDSSEEYYTTTKWLGIIPKKKKHIKYTYVLVADIYHWEYKQTI